MEAVETIQEYLVDRAQNRNQLVEELFAETETYLIGRNSVGRNFRWAKLFVGRNFRRQMISSLNENLSHSPDEKISSNESKSVFS